MAPGTTNHVEPTAAPAAPGAGGRPRLVEGALATLRSPVMMAVLVTPSLAIGALAFSAGQLDQAVRVMVFMFFMLFAAASWDAGELAAISRWARSHGLRFARNRWLRFYAMPGPPRRLGAYPNRCKTVLTGPVAGGPSGIVVVQFPNEARGTVSRLSTCLPIVCYDLSASGGDLATWSFAVRTDKGQISRDPPDDAMAGRLLKPAFAGWLAEAGGVSFELGGGRLFVVHAGCRTASSAGLDRLTQAAAHVAARVLELASAPAEPESDRGAAAPKSSSGQVAATGPTTAAAAASIDAEYKRAAYLRIAARIEADMRTLGWWSSVPPEQPIAGAFGETNATFTQWLQFVLCPRLHEIAAGTAEAPQDSSVAVRAVREFDGWPQAEPLIKVLSDLDHLAGS
jgi:uncharacterized protein YqcC (DUF446 family)